MADKNSAFTDYSDTGPDSFVKQQKALMDKTSTPASQVYGDKKMSVDQMRGKFNQVNTPNGMETSTESRKRR
jgi:hypothetical protein